MEQTDYEYFNGLQEYKVTFESGGTLIFEGDSPDHIRSIVESIKNLEGERIQTITAL